MERAADSIQVLDRAAALLTELANHAQPLSLAELAAATGLSKSTTRRVLASMEAHDLCERRSAGIYALGLRLLELGTVVRDRLDARELARPDLQQLAAATNLSAFLCVRRGERAICIDRVDGRYAHTMALKIGGSLPLHVGAGPKAMLASAALDDVRRYLNEAGELRRLTARTITSRDALLEDLQLARERGWTLSHEDMTESVSAVGAAIRDDAGGVVGAISVSGLTPHVVTHGVEELAEQVVRSAAVVSRKLGFTEEARDPLTATSTAL